MCFVNYQCATKGIAVCNLKGPYLNTLYVLNIFTILFPTGSVKEGICLGLNDW